MTRALPLLLLAVLTVWIAAPSLEVGHLSDDWVIVNYVHRHGNAAAWTDSWLGLRSMLFHRPFFTQLYAFELQLFGADPFPAHVHHLAWHVGAVLLLYGFVRRLGGDARAAFAAGLLFAWYPSLPGAVGWLAARCGTVAGTLTLGCFVAFLGWRERGGAWRYGLSVLCAVVACLTRESGYLALIGPLTLDVVLRRPRLTVPTLVRTHAAFAACGVGLLALRFRALGTLAGGYSHTYAQPMEALRTHFSDLGEAFRWLAVGVTPDFAFGAVEVLNWAPWLVFGMVAFALGVAMFHRMSIVGAGALRTLLTVAALSLTQLALLLATGPKFAPSTGQRWYVAIGFVCVLLGATAHRSWLRFAVVMVLAFAVYRPLHDEVQWKLIEGNHYAETVLDRVDAQLRDLPADTDAVFISGLEEARAGHPLFQWAFMFAVRPPFRERAGKVPVYPLHPFMNLSGTQLTGFSPSWSLHPPVELLLYARGLRPVALQVTSGTSKVEIIRAGADDLGALGSPDDVRTKLLPQLAGGVLTGIEPSAPMRLQTRRGMVIPYAFTASRPGKVELFCMMPSLDMRFVVEVKEGRNEFDLGPRLEDFAIYPDEPLALLVVPAMTEGGRTFLGDVAVFECAP